MSENEKPVLDELTEAEVAPEFTENTEPEAEPIPAAQAVTGEVPAPAPAEGPAEPPKGKKGKEPLAPGLYRSPFSKAYWADATKELKSTRMLVVAAILTAVRIVLKSVQIPVAPPTLYINIGFFVNALGAGIFGPVVALLCAAISDTLGAILFPTGTYFFPFIFTEMAGSLIFALFLYRAPRTELRVSLSRFCVCFFVNIVLQSPIMLLYYKLILGKSYALFDLPRIIKNLVLFPIESLLLLGFFNLMDPITYKMGLTHEPPKKKQITKGVLAFILIMFIVGSCATGGYYWYDYNTRNHASDFETYERAAYNEELAEEVGAADDELVLVNTIYKKAFQDGETVTYSVYTVDESVCDDWSSLWGLKNTAAAKNESLTYVDKLTIERGPAPEK